MFSSRVNVVEYEEKPVERCLLTQSRIQCFLLKLHNAEFDQADGLLGVGVS